VAITYPGKDLSALRRNARYLDRGYNVVKMKIGGAPITEDRETDRGGSEGDRHQAQLAVDANGRFDLETAIAYARCCGDYPAVLVRGAAIPSIMRCRPRSPNSIQADGDRRKLFSHQDARNLIRYAHAAGFATAAVRTARCPMGYANISARSRCCTPMAGRPAAASAWRAPDVTQHRRRLGLGGNESYPDLFQPYGGFPDGVRVENGHIAMPICRASALRGNPISTRR